METTHWTTCCPGLVTISLIRWSAPIWERAAAASPPGATGAFVVSCSMTLTFGCCGLEFGWIGVAGIADGTGYRMRTGWSAAEGEVEGEAEPDCGLLPVHDRRVEASLLGPRDRRAVQVTVAAGVLDRPWHRV